MGLDMYAYAVRPEDVISGDAVDIRIKKNAKQIEVHYWRKHHDLHGWMEELYRRKGGAAGSFNCVGIRLTEADLDELEESIRKRKLPPTTGFFFGDNPPDDESDADDLVFIAEARLAIKNGAVVYYSSWW